jgi:iron-sulfur cluster repair protein YtfE (RIC family)
MTKHHEDLADQLNECVHEARKVVKTAHAPHSCLISITTLLGWRRMGVILSLLRGCPDQSAQVYLDV